MFNKFDVRIKFRDNCYGGIPKSKKMVEAYVAAKFQSDDISTVATDLDLTEETERVTTGFKADEVGVYFGDYAVKAGLKQWASLLKLTTQKRGTKNTIAETLFIKGVLNDELTHQKIYFQPLRKEADGLEDFAGHVMTMQGKRSILKSAEFIHRGELHFQIWVVKVRMSSHKELTADDLRLMLELGQEGGFASCRSFEKGKFDVLHFEELG